MFEQQQVTEKITQLCIDQTLFNSIVAGISTVFAFLTSVIAKLWFQSKSDEKKFIDAMDGKTEYYSQIIAKLTNKVDALYERLVDKSERLDVHEEKT